MRIDLDAIRKRAEAATSGGWGNLADSWKDIAALLAEVERLRARVEKAESELWPVVAMRNRAFNELEAARAALARLDDREAVAKVVAAHTPELIHEGPNGEDDGQHLYCVECGVLPIDGLGLQDGPQHVVDHLIAYVRGDGA
jgi:hypothetical protein